MKTSSLITITVFALMLGEARAADNELTAAEKKDGWTLLFDGKSLDGWDGDPNIWRVENGCLSGKAEKVAHNTFLIYKDKFSDFILQADCMLLKGKGFTNSGIQYRSRVINKKEWIVGGYQADIGEGWWGANYEEQGRGILWKPTDAATKAVQADGWNHFEISAIGTKVKETLNGVVSGELDDQDPKARKSGILALQYHAPGQNFEIRFKNLKLKNLAPPEPAEAK